MTIYLLDTKIVGHIIKGDLPQVRERLAAVPLHAVAISVVTQGELLYGVAKRGHPTGLAARVREFLARVTVLPWTQDVAAVYGQFRADCEAAGKRLEVADMMIAAHAKALSADTGAKTILITHDRAFSNVGGLHIEDWTAAGQGVSR